MNTVLERPIAVPELTPGKWLLAVPAVLYALLVLPFVFHDVVGEPDLERTAMAILYGASSGLHESAGYHYGLGVSFGYYAAFYHLLPRAVLLDSSALIAAINFLGYGCAVVAIAMLALYVSRLFGVVTAVVTCILFAFSPVFLDMGTSGHPQVPGLALTLAGAWLLTYATDTGLRGAYRILAGMGALVVLTAGLTVRGDFSLAFPFITLVAAPGRELQSRRRWLLAAGQRCGVLLSAFVAFLILRSFAYDSGPGGDSSFVSDFFATFYKAETVPRGLMVVVLCTGMATMWNFVGLLLWRPARTLPLVNVLAIVALALPSLVFWLPNSTPGRHLILVTLAIALTLALMLRAVQPRWAIAAAAAAVLANQAVAEVSHGWMERHYRWTYPLLTARRATQSVPMGAFPPDHEAKQEAFMVLRNEGRAFARSCSGKVLAFAEEPHYMMLSLVEMDPTVRLQTVRVGDTNVFQARGARCSVDFVEKAAAWHRDALKEFLEAGYDVGWPIYFQEARRNPSDRTEVPEERRYCAKKTVDGWCDSAASSG